MVFNLVVYNLNFNLFHPYMYLQKRGLNACFNPLKSLQSFFCEKDAANSCIENLAIDCHRLIPIEKNDLLKIYIQLNQNMSKAISYRLD